MINLDDIRGKLAAKYNFLFGKDDPSLAMVALFETVLEQSLADLNAQQKAYLDAVNKSIQKGSDEAKVVAGRVITESSAYASKQIQAAIETAMSESEERIKKKLANYLTVMDDMRYEAKIFRNVSIVAACFSALCFAALNVF